MKYNYMHMEGQEKGLGTSRNLIVMVKLHMASVDLIKIAKENFMSWRLVHFPIHFIMLMPS